MASEVNYNDGKWHGWNGGECPVHPESVVDVVYSDFGWNGPTIKTDPARHASWGGGKLKLIAFRVIHEHKEPREFWHVVSQSGHVIEVYKEKAAAVDYAKGARGRAVIHVREVIDNG